MIPKRTRRLRARAAAMSTPDSEFEEYGPEPNMKLSHAFLVVLMLHVVAVGGLYAFNSMKASKAPKLTTAKISSPAEQPPGPSQGQSPKQEEPKKQPPSGEKKTPLVAKTSEAPKAAKVTENVVQKPSAPESLPNAMEMKSPSQPRTGLLAGTKAAFARITGVGVAGSGIAATAVAQESSNPAAEPPVAPPSSSAKAYIVKAGDTMTRIAASLGVSIPDLEKSNGLAGNAVLRVGQSLKIPEKIIAQAAAGASAEVQTVTGSVQQIPGSIAAAAGAAVTSMQGGSNAPVSTLDLTEYAVVKGDNPYKIAKKFKITPDELMKANGITDPKKIQIGQKLKIPASLKKPSGVK